MKVFARIDDNHSKYPNGYWWLMMSRNGNEDLTITELINGENYRFENRFGGGFAYEYDRDDKKILELCEADDWSDLDWGTVLLRSESKYGYIDPEGNWYGCNYEDHSILVKYVLRSEAPEEHGWVKVYRGHDGETEYYSTRRFLDERQVHELINRKIEVRIWDLPDN